MANRNLRFDRAMLVELVGAQDAVVLRGGDRLQQIGRAGPAALDGICEDHDGVVGHDIPVHGGTLFAERPLDRGLEASHERLLTRRRVGAVQEKGAPHQPHLSGLRSDLALENVGRRCVVREQQGLDVALGIPMKLAA